MNRSGKKIKLALMTYAMDNRIAKGSSLYARKLTEELVKDKDLEVFLVHFDRVEDPIYQKGTEILIKKVKFPLATRFVSLMWFFWQYRNNKFDIIHWFQPRMYPFFWFAPAKKIVVTAHGGGDKTTPGRFVFSRKVFNFILTNFNRFIDLIIAGSDFGRKEIIDSYHTDPTKTVVTYYGGSEVYQPLDKKEAFEEVSRKYSIAKPFVLNVSRLQPHKNINRLIKAYLKMRDNVNKDIGLVVAGWPTSDYEETYRLARESNYSNDILFIDYVDADFLNTLYSAAEIFVFPSLNEGFGLPVVEAMASGTAVITSNVTSLSEVAGNAAMTIDPLDVEDLCQAMTKLILDDELAGGYRQKGLEWVKRFTWENTANQTKRFYYDLLDGNI